MSPRILPAPSGSAPAVAEAAACLRAGGLVAFPTETVYGLGADGLNPVAAGTSGNTKPVHPEGSSGRCPKATTAVRPGGSGAGTSASRGTRASGVRGA